MPHIKLQKLVNCRDLGGFVTADGRKVKSKRLIRSETLFEATEKDLKCLTETYDLKTVIDFRTDIEREQKPDPEIEGVKNIFNPIVVAETLGITRERVDYKDMPKIFAGMKGDPLEYMENMYRNMALDGYAREHYKNFFSLLLSQSEGAVLWHCSAGKDRVGIGTALLLTALDVDRETIIEDYLMTGYYYRFFNFKLRLLITVGIRDKSVREFLRYLLDVKREYIVAVFEGIEKEYGSVGAYLEKEMGLDEENLKKLKEMYLEA